MSDILDQIRENLVGGRVDSQDEGFEGDMAGQPGVKELVEKAIEEKISPGEILSKALNVGMEEVGRLYESGEYLIPDMLASAECVNEAMGILEPLLLDADVSTKGRFIIATVEGDLHDIGKNIVATLLRGAGYEVRDLGTSIPADTIVETVRATEAQFVGLSALLTTTMDRMEEVIDKLEQAGLREKVKVLIGGAPVSAEFAEKIGADFYCEDAFDAIGKLNGAGVSAG
jgi:5-methyltetrahydrofolate--homocysteine methyltransferase